MISNNCILGVNFTDRERIGRDVRPVRGLQSAGVVMDEVKTSKN